MQTFRRLCRDKLSDPAFAACYREACHVCAHTIGIGAVLDGQPGKIAAAASALEATPEAIQDLIDAEYCDPDLTTRLCRYLALPAPTNCPRAR